jgi:carbohydrate-selective porin OprB
VNLKKLFFLSLFIIFFSSPAAADSVRDELKALKTRIEQLEKKLSEQDTKIEKQETVIAEHDSSFKELEGIKDVVSGLEISLGATSVVQGTDGNGNDSTDATYSVDLEITSKIGENGTALLYLEGGEGSGVYPELGGFNGYNADAFADPDDDGADLQISEIWYEHSFKEGKVVATFGKMDVTRWFDANEVANDETSQFLADVFVNNIAVEFPDYAYGARVTISLNEMFDISFGALEADSDYEDIFDENFLIAELGIKPKILCRQGNYRIYGWTNNGDKEDLKDPDKSQDDGHGVGISMDQEITDAITAFARFGWQNDDVYAVEYAGSLGFQVAGSLWGRDEDMFGLGYARSEIGEDYRDSLRADGMRTAPAEQSIEAYYSFKVNDHISLSPDIQYAKDREGKESEDSVFVFGLRAQLDF